MTDPPTAGRSRVTWLDLFAVACVAAAVWGPVLRTGFSPLDDIAMLANNPAMNAPSWAAFADFWTGPQFRIYMPLALSAWQAIAALTVHDLVLSPLPFKIASMVTQVAAAVAAAWTLSTLTRTRWPAVVAALAFAVHPLHVEAVAWTTGLKDQLCGLFSIVAIGLYARHAERDPPTPWADAWWWAALTAAVVAMLAKPTAMVLPVLFLAVDWSTRRADVVRRLRSILPVLLPAIGCALIALTVQASPTVERMPLALRPLLAADTYAFYLRKLVWPFDFSPDYGRRPLVALRSGAVWWTWLVPLATLAGVAALRSRRVWLAAALFVVPVLPVSGLNAFDMQQYSTVADHYTYQSLLGVGLLAAVAVGRWPRAAGTAAVVAVLATAVLTRHELDHWRDVNRFYVDALRINPGSHMARRMVALNAADRGDFTTAQRLSLEALAKEPDNGNALATMSEVRLALGDYRGAADYGVRAMDRVQLPRLSLARQMVAVGTQKLKDLDVTERGLRHWLRVEPDNTFARRTLAMVIQARRTQAATRPAADGR